MGILSLAKKAGKALLSLLMGDNDNNKARFMIEGSDDEIVVQFNPEKYSVSEKVEYQQIVAQGTDKNITQYAGSVESVSNLSFYFDTDSVLATSPTSSQMASDVSALTHEFSSLLNVVGELHRPPIVTFTWGSIFLEGFITKVDTSFTMFDEKGVPVRAKVDCQLLSLGNTTAIQREPLMSPDRTKSRILSEDTNIWAIAHAEYGDINQWRNIAKANGILDPMEIPVGSVLKVPAILD